VYSRDIEARGRVRVHLKGAQTVLTRKAFLRAAGVRIPTLQSRITRLRKRAKLLKDLQEVETRRKAAAQQAAIQEISSVRRAAQGECDEPLWRATVRLLTAVVDLFSSLQNTTEWQEGKEEGGEHGSDWLEREPEDCEVQPVRMRRVLCCIALTPLTRCTNERCTAIVFGGASMAVDMERSRRR
jgi:hypothetical protein